MLPRKTRSVGSRVEPDDGDDAPRDARGEADHSRRRLDAVPEGARADDVEAAGKRTRHAAAKASAGDVGSSLARARDAADRRGRALNELGDKSAQMAHAAGDFNAMCKALAAKQDKKIFGIF